MAIQINYNKNTKKQSNSNLVLFVDEKFNIHSLKNHLSSSEYNFVSDLLKVRDLKRKITNFDLNSKKKNHINFSSKEFVKL